MSSAGLALQTALVTALRANTALAALVGQRVYDNVPPSAAYPYVALGGDQTLPDRADCYEGEDITVTLDIWSRQPGFPEARRIAAAILDALAAAPLVVAGHRVVDLAPESTRFIRDPDGLTSHGVLTLTVQTEPV